MEELTYPRWRQGIKAGLIGGALVAVIIFLMCCWIAGQPAETQTSLPFSFRPWWRWSNWAISICGFAIVVVGIGAIVALRPHTRTGR